MRLALNRERKGKFVPPQNNSLLVLNAGSSSLKFASFVDGRELVRGSVDQIGRRARFVLDRGQGQTVQAVQATTPSRAFGLLRAFLRKEKIVPDVIAHRIVHGGEKFYRPTKLTSSVLRQLKNLVSLAPLHMPANIQAVRLASRAWPLAAEWGVFDTAAYHHLPDRARLYSIPLSVAERWHIRKYGFHGISHQWAMREASKKLRRPVNRLNLVTIHLGAGDSMTRWQAGRAADTTMGFTPLEGLTMSTRSGDLDPMIPLFLQQHGWSLKKVIDMLQQRSGLFGITGLRDMRDILGAAGHGLPGWPRRSWTAGQRRHARLALDMFVYDIQRYLSSYLGLAPRTAAIVFTGAIGQNKYIQGQIIRSLPAARGYRVLTIPTDEERAIAVTVGNLVH